MGVTVAVAQNEGVAAPAKEADVDAMLKQAQDLLAQGRKAQQDGDAALEQKQYKAAADLFAQVQKEHEAHPLAPKALLLAGQCQMRMKDWKSAVETLERLLETYPKEEGVQAETRYWLGDSYAKAENYEDAYRMFKKLTWDYPEAVWAKYARGRLTEPVYQGMGSGGDADSDEGPSVSEKPAGAEPVWPHGVTHIKFRFIRLKYDGPGWDDGMDEKSGADVNFLDHFTKLTGFKTAKTGESHGISLLAKYPKGFAPPFVYMTGSGEISVTTNEVTVLQKYLAAGGMLVADCGDPKWDASFRALMATAFPGKSLQDIPDADPLYQFPYVFKNGAPPLWHHAGRRALGIKNRGRWAVFYHPGDMNDAWKTGHSGLAADAAEPAFELGVNLVYYALTHYLDVARHPRE